MVILCSVRRMRREERVCVSVNVTIRCIPTSPMALGKVEPNLTLDSILQHVIVNDLITNCVTRPFEQLPPTDRTLCVNALSHRQFIVRSVPEIVRVRSFPFDFVFLPSDTQSTKSRTLTFSTVGRGHGPTRRQYKGPTRFCHRSVVAMVVIWDRVRLVSASFPKAKAKQQN